MFIKLIKDLIEQITDQLWLSAAFFILAAYLIIAAKLDLMINVLLILSAAALNIRAVFKWYNKKLIPNRTSWRQNIILGKQKDAAKIIKL